MAFAVASGVWIVLNCCIHLLCIPPLCIPPLHIHLCAATIYSYL